MDSSPTNLSTKAQDSHNATNLTVMNLTPKCEFNSERAYLVNALVSMTHEELVKEVFVRIKRVSITTC